jgi:hypothetical protein
MRSFLLKYTFGRYWWKFWFQTHYNYTQRGPFWYYNGYLLLGLIFLASGGTWDWVLFIPALIWTAVVLYMGFPLFGFSYYERHPAKWHELDEEQKWYYGRVATMNVLSKKLEFTSSMMTEWISINQRMRVRYNLKY